MKQYFNHEPSRYMLVFVSVSTLLCVLLLLLKMEVAQHDLLATLLVMFLIVAQLILYFVYKNAKDKSEYMSQVTGLPNRQKFLADIQELLKKPELKDKLAVISIDVDEFKLVNNLLGYNEGTKVIKYIGEVLQENLEAPAGCYHVRSDMFYIIVADEDLEGAMQRTHDKMDKISRHYRDVYAMNLFLSAGCYKFEPEMYEKVSDISEQGKANFKQALAVCEDNANLARKMVKKKFQNYVMQYHASMRENEVRGKLMEDAFMIALENREFVVYYQPKYAMVDDEAVLCGAEALVRWDSSVLGFLMPGQFVPAFEDDGNIVLLDMYLTDAVCNQIRDWLFDGYDVPPISINVSRKTISKENDYYGCVRHAMELNDVPKDLVEFEILESASSDDENQLISFINRFHDNGYRIALDDFGTGYSSLGFLGRVSFDVLKMDRSFFSSWQKDQPGKKEAIVRNVLRMAQDLGIKTVAEGIEHQFQVDILKEMGCDAIQGFYFGKPMPEPEFRKLMKLQTVAKPRLDEV